MRKEERVVSNKGGKMRKLPIGIQTFEKLKIYIFYNVRVEFGKSLLISTLKEVFKGIVHI